MSEKVVAHYLQGKLVRGITRDFSAIRKSFHVEVNGEDAPVEIHMSELKAVFFVRDLEGDRYHQEDPAAERPEMGRRVKIRFLDGEVLLGHTKSYSSDESGFYVYPADCESNNEKIYVMKAATDSISFSNLMVPIHQVLH